jgi:fructose-1,6-bisphosphatase class II
MDRNFALEFVRVTEAAALASARLMGRGDEKEADHAAVEAMRKMLGQIQFDGTVVIGEGERDEAPMLYIGEKVGKGPDPKLDLALDPLEGTTICARGGNNALSVIAIAEHGNFLHAPDTYMNKIAVGPDAKGAIDLQASPTENLRNIARAKKCNVEDLTVIILDRPRHTELIAEVRRAGARIWLIGDGDVSAAIATCKRDSGVDVLMGVGGAPEGVIAAAALRCTGGDFQGQLVFRKEEERARALKMGIQNLDKVYRIDELAKGHVMFCATGVTQGTYLNGVRFFSGGAQTHSVVMRSESGTVRFIEAEHHFDRKPKY